VVARALRLAPLVLGALAACRATTPSTELADAAAPEVRPAAPGETAYALHVGKVLTCDADDTVVNRGQILVRSGKIEYVGRPIDVPDGFVAIDLPRAWAAPGFVDLHSHVVGPGFDINDMVYPVNADLSTRPSITPANDLMRVATAAGVTTLFLIPGSGTSIGGFGVLFKTKTGGGYEESVLRDPGGMKSAYNFNPQRGAGDVGSTWAGLQWLTRDANDKAAAALAQGRDDWELANLMRVHAGELPVLVHCASAEGVAGVARLWKKEYGTNVVMSHGSWDGWRAGPYLAELGVPANHGPRTMNFTSMVREERVVGGAAEYLAAGVPLFSLNTDAPVVPQEELFLQGSMSARLGADQVQMLRALTTHPAQAILVGDRVGSLEVGKDADVVLSTGDPLDPRSAVELVLIDGEIQYSRQEDSQWF
jgi:imidazolonepropionase-like amidohydrolase